MSVKSIKAFGSPVEFASFGKTALAYVKSVSADDMKDLYPDEADMQSAGPVWGLFAADGEAISFADEPAALVMDAEELDLLTVALH